MGYLNHFEIVSKPTEIIFSYTDVCKILSEYLKNKGYDVDPNNIKMHSSTYKEAYSGKTYGFFEYAKAVIKED